jgi:hypothetical protein
MTAIEEHILAQRTIGRTAAGEHVVATVWRMSDGSIRTYYTGITVGEDGLLHDTYYGAERPPLVGDAPPPR